MKDGKIGNAIRTLNSDAKGKVLSLKDKIGNKTVAEIIDKKHPEGQPINPSCLVSQENADPLPFNNSIFDIRQKSHLILRMLHSRRPTSHANVRYC